MATIRDYLQAAEEFTFPISSFVALNVFMIELEQDLRRRSIYAPLETDYERNFVEGDMERVQLSIWSS